MENAQNKNLCNFPRGCNNKKGAIKGILNTTFLLEMMLDHS